ncbi:unnamed protein product [Rhizophagus irregularis]|nr:unnamed protein product [Rhizophagus irregularis]CAB5385980.1 unnamed protein product [Rhizophagus irregularis]
MLGCISRKSTNCRGRVQSIYAKAKIYVKEFEEQERDLPELSLSVKLRMCTACLNRAMSQKEVLKLFLKT